MNYYELLNINMDADITEIKTSYRKLAMQYHPDRNPGDTAAENKFKQINEAYAILSDPKKRAQFDQFGTSDTSNIDMSDLIRNFGTNFGSSGFGDLLGGFFGGFSGQASRPSAGSDIEDQIDISFKESVLGTTKKIDVEYEKKCSACGGAGGKTTSCPKCGGSGSIRKSHGFISLVSACPKCGGTGKIISTKCKSCDGHGMLKDANVIAVKIPPGIDTGNYKRLIGYGHMGRNGGPNGDLYIIFRVINDTPFIREGRNLILEQPISFVDATLGGNITVNTIDGVSKIKIPAGTDTGNEFILRNKGIRGGNQIVKVFIKTPKHLTEKAKEHFRKFAEAYEEKADDNDILEKIKTFFRKRGSDEQQYRKNG